MFAVQMLHVNDVFIVGGFWFWILLAGVFVATTILTQWDRTYSAFATVVALVLSLQCLSNADPLGYIWHHPQWAFMWAGLFLVAGVLTSLWKWRSYTTTQREIYEDAKVQWLESKNIYTGKLPENLIDAWEKHLSTKFVPGLEMSLAEIKSNRGPSFWRHMGRCLTWATYWPCTLFWMLLNNPIRNLFKRAILMLRGVYESIAANAWAGVEDDFKKTAKPAEPVAMGADGNPIP